MIRIIKKMSVWAILGSVLFMVIQIISDLYLPTLTSNIIDKGVTQGDSKYILQVGMIMIGVSLIGIVASLVNTLIATREGQKIGKKLRSEIYETVSYSSLESFDKVGTASLITRTTNDVNQVQMVTQMFLRLMINAPITLIGASFLAYTRDPELTKIFLYIIPSLIIIVGIVMYFAIPLFKTLQEKTDKLNLVFREGLTGVRVIRAFNKTPFEEKRFFNANKDYTQTAVKVNILMSFLMPVITLIISITNVSIIWYGGHNVAQGTLEVGNMMAFMTYAMQILMSFMMMTMIFVLVPRAQASAVRINEVLDMNKEKELTNDQQIKKEVPTLDFNDICFRYKGAEKPALLGVDFHLKAGETLAIIGGTGSGKTSLVNLIPRFYDIEKGSILFNEQNVQDLDVKELRNRVGFVPQKAILFTGTIRSNLLYGLENATEEEMWKALEIAQAKDFVKKLPDGLDSKVEQGGDNFSGGQKQRLAIARALIKPADIYIFDDSFSALDFKTDALLRKALKENVTDAMIVIVAQRISTVVGADQIIVLDEGLMVGKGNHQELKETNETYQDIIKSQLREEEIA
ncbi:ABC transporter ATP-binding protein [Vagococcus fluvialis]|uniref:ABC transporter ATP-binding protein n=1 Tax=Vagococcus fluvialis TaxID=2738 RepID=UPI001A8D0E34|nr:ABC transporter ATP-binding protein [Vagococcus fluvialis]MBO0478018.1 ABC transporter ATP-binding protein [Vagococcus fluvialis]MBO0483273.1 ABC transporter ATP-binding protein [Vagococcus fluvialis]MDT2748075.1 ABC transporter ATP-binding protein [Vagococcus fluvialis]UDM72096.1 ABC transporter ATP-binding protein/permease [Vagococcus fluvialis]UDM72881.1 ABC transporter ATP-binding protein/permease [Vagococcus fluvialis]